MNGFDSVLKFGGTSVGSAKALKQVAQIIANENSPKGIAVVSAMSGITNQLIELGNQAKQGKFSYRTLLSGVQDRHLMLIQELGLAGTTYSPEDAVRRLLLELEAILQGIYLIREFTPRTLDLVCSFGERLTSLILASLLQKEGIQAVAVDARNLIETDNRFNNARVDFGPTKEKVKQHFESANGWQILTGFIASTVNKETTTLGRGGSDYTAAIIGAAIEAKLIEIYTDVDGMMTADPRLVPQAFVQEQISYLEAMELSHFGAKVIYPPTLQPAIANQIPITIRNTFRPDFKGTLITKEGQANPFPIRGISHINEVAVVSVEGSGIVGTAGFSSRVFRVLAESEISVILISQASSEHSICLALEPSAGEKARKVLEQEFEGEVARGGVDRVSVTYQQTIISLIGENMRAHSGIAGKLFLTLGANGINVVAMAQGSSELNISVVINQKDLRKALIALHEAFFTGDTTHANLFLIGPGLIGSTLLSQIKAQLPYLRENRKMAIRLVGVANSKKMAVKSEGIALDAWRQELEVGQTSDIALFIKQMIELNLPNTVLVDCTAGQVVIPYYAQVLKASVDLITPNKLANSGSMEQYLELKRLARTYNTNFFYETNVGAGLPVLTTLGDLVGSGDKILKIEGVLSGTLSYIFNTYAGKSFASVVREAQDKGYTEPDPREDLNGKDVGRKILILARELGVDAESIHIDIENILPESALNATSVELFYKELELNDDFFAQMFKAAETSGRKLRFIAKVEGEEIQVKLRRVGPESPFYNMTGTDNLIAFTTERYKDQPLIVRGPGAGAQVTAAGIFAELIKATR